MYPFPGDLRARRQKLIPTLAAVGALTLAVSACGSADGSADGAVELRFSWWGSDERHVLLEEVIENFEAENPDIRVTGENTDWASYWDRLATNTAADDAPDVIMQDESYLREYGDRGALADLDEFSDDLDLSSLDPNIAESGEMDGENFGVATGINVSALLADPEAFEAAGVDMPDDTTWTWDDYIETSIEISENTDGEIVGTQGMTNENGFHIFARQHGENLYDEDGDLAFSPETLEAWFQVTKDLLDSGGQPDASQSVEIEAGGPDQSVLATNDGAMAHFWSNQLGGITGSSDRDIQLLRYPGESENERTGMFFKPAMFYSISSGTDHPEEAARFVDYMLNEPAVAELMLADLGLPANLEVREHILEDLPEADAQVAEFMSEVEGTIVDGNPPPPIGAGEVVEIVKRISDDLAFETITPAEAAEQFISEVEQVTESS